MHQHYNLSSIHSACVHSTNRATRSSCKFLEATPPPPPHLPAVSWAGPFQQQSSSHSRGNRNKTNVGHSAEGGFWGGEGPTAPGGRLHVVVSRDSNRCSNVCEKVEKKKQTERKGGNTERGGRGARGQGIGGGLPHRKKFPLPI